jgi:hypothetical protein
MGRFVMSFIRLRVSLSAVAALALLVAPDVALALHAAPVPRLQLVRRPESSSASSARPDSGAVSAASTEVVEAQRELARTAASLRQAMLESPAYADAADALRQARTDYQAASLAVLDTVRSTSDYKLRQSTVFTAEQRLDRVRADQQGTADDLRRAATDVAAARSVLSKLEAQALGADASVTSSKQRMIEATRTVVSLQQQLRATLLTDPAWSAARRRLEQARHALASAG